MAAPSHQLPLKPRRRGNERREEILAHTLRLMSESGVHNVSTRQIAQAVGISQPSLYAHFPHRHALVSEVCSRAFHALTKRMQAVAEQPGLPEDRLVAVAHTYVAFALEQPDAYRVAFMIEGAPADHQGAGDVALAAGLEAFRIHRSCVAAVMPESTPAAVIDRTAQSLWASLHGLVSLLIARPGFPWVNQQSLIDHHVAVMIRSL